MEVFDAPHGRFAEFPWNDEALVMLVAWLLTRHANRPVPRTEVAPAIRMALERLDAAPAAPVTLAELAALSGVSHFQLLRGFAREVGIPPCTPDPVARGSPVH